MAYCESTRKGLIYLQKSDLCIYVVSNPGDTGVGVSENGTSSGTGLRNVRDRLRLRYGPDAVLTLKPVSPSGVDALISIPLANL